MLAVPCAADSLRPMTAPSTFASSEEEHLDWRVSSLVAAGACAAIGLLECAKDYVMQGIQGNQRALLSAFRDKALWWVLWMLLMPAVISLARHFPFDSGRWK